MKEIKSMRMRRFIAKYIRYLEILAYTLILLVGTGVVMAWCWRVDVTCKSDAVELAPFEHTVKAPAECVVLELPVAENAPVRKGQVVAVVCTNAQWVARAKAESGLREALDALRAAPVTADEDGAFAGIVEARMVEWNKRLPPESVPIESPADGVLGLKGLATGAVVLAGKKLVKVKDFSLLRGEFTFSDKNAYLCRPGMKGWVEINTKQGFETVVMLDVDTRPGVPYFGARRDEFTQLAAAEIRAAFTNAVLGKELLDAERAKLGDFALPVSGVNNVAIQIRGHGKLVDRAQTALEPEGFRIERHPALLIDGSHTAGLTLIEVDPDARAKVAGLLSQSLADKPIAVPGGHYVLEEGIEKFVFSLEAKAKKKMPAWDWKARPEGSDAETLLAQEQPGQGVTPSKKVKYKARKFAGTVQLVAPDKRLQALVQRLAREDKALSVKAHIVVGRTPFAMLLFRKR